MSIEKIEVNKKARYIPIIARIDSLQSITGFILACFIMLHLLLEASILISKDAMLTVAHFFEGYYFFGETYPSIISFLAVAIGLIFIIHALTALRKFPANYQQLQTYSQHNKQIKHIDSLLWLVQVVTGFMLFFLVSIHLYTMFSQPDKIGPYASADRIYSEYMWIVYLLLLISVVFHAFIGLYRLAMKWGLFSLKSSQTLKDKIKQSRSGRQWLKKIMYILIAIYLIIGLMSLLIYLYIGYQHKDNIGERYSYSVRGEQ